MIEKLANLKNRYELLNEKLSDPTIFSRSDEFKKISKEHADLRPIIDAYNELCSLAKAIAEAKEIFDNGNDPELEELARQEYDDCCIKKADMEEKLKILMLPPDPNDDKNVIVEIRAGAGGDEAGLFGAALMRMYKMYAEAEGWKSEDLNINISELGGVKEVIFLLSGNKVYAKMKFESGVHRVQRVPETETQGRVHTSTVTVAVLPEIEDVVVEINEKDLKVDTYRSGGAGGQHVNKTESAIRITHIPTGLVVTCEDERSQIKNRDKAMKVLKSRLYDMYETEANSEYAATRKGQVGTGDRSERIRTYNFPQGRVTDHRIGYTIYSIANFMNGDIGGMVEQLRLADQTARLEKISES